VKPPKHCRSFSDVPRDKLARPPGYERLHRRNERSARVRSMDVPSRPGIEATRCGGDCDLGRLHCGHALLAEFRSFPVGGQACARCGDCRGAAIRHYPCLSCCGGLRRVSQQLRRYVRRQAVQAGRRECTAGGKQHRDAIHIDSGRRPIHGEVRMERRETAWLFPESQALPEAMMPNEFCLTAGYRRKTAIRLLNGPREIPPKSRGAERFQPSETRTMQPSGVRMIGIGRAARRFRGKSFRIAFHRVAKGRDGLYTIRLF
jgi:hypothetical protein